MGIYNFNAKNYQKALEFFKKQEAINDIHERKESYSGYFGDCYYEIGDYQKALDCHLDWLVKVKNDDEKRLLDALDPINISFQPEKYDKFSSEVAFAYSKVVMDYKALGNNELANEYFNLGMEYCKTILEDDKPKSSRRGLVEI